jgi:predicted permease
MPVLLGRGLNVTDDKAAAKVAVINQTFAQKYFGTDFPVGRRFGFGGPDQAGDIEIVGVSKDAKYDGLRSKIKPTVFVSYLQRLPREVNFSVRTRGDAAAMILPIRQAIHDLDKNLPLFDVKTEDQQVDEILVQERLFARLSGFFGLLALLLSSIGIYGVMSYSVARRTNEMGIRMALGALRGDVIRLVLRETLVLVVAGLGLGLGAALLTTTLISKMLYGLAPNDPFTIAFSILVLISIAALAGYLPARRAARVDPMIALRYE